MTDKELKQLYEKLYFHEIEAREKIHGRLQLPLTLILAIIGVVAYLIQSINLNDGVRGLPWGLFIVLAILGCLALGFATYWFIKALYNHTYQFLPDSVQTAQYRSLLEETYKQYPSKDVLIAEAMDAYVNNSYIKHGAFNTRVNDRRSAYIHLCHGATIAAGIFLIGAATVFYFGELGRNGTQPVFLCEPY